MKKGTKREPELKVICYNCGKAVPKSEAFYIVQYDSYLCEKDYLQLLNGETVKLNNWRRSGV